MTMAVTCSEDSITVLCSNFNRSLKEAADYLEASSIVINEGIIMLKLCITGPKVLSDCIVAVTPT